MALSMNSVSTLQEYINGAMNRSEHRMGKVDGVSLALLGATIWMADGKIEVKHQMETLRIPSGSGSAKLDIRCLTMIQWSKSN